MSEKDTKIHARWWTQEYPGDWRDRGELEADVDDLLVGTRLHDHFACQAVEQLYLRDGTQFRISRKGMMQDYVVRAEMAWSIAPVQP